MGEWQPIETAPKDGTRILAWRQVDEEYGPQGGMEVVQWRNDSRLRTGGYFWYGANHSRYSTAPTHWMPLPEPPAEGGEREK